MRDVLLVRHGRAASNAAGHDSARPLTAEGRAEIGGVARGLRSLGLRPDVVMHSPFVRTTETGRILAETLQAARMSAEPALTPESDAATAASLIGRATGRCLIVVSHMPLLPALLAEFTGARVEFGTGTVAHLRVFGPRAAALLGLWGAEFLVRVRSDGP